MQWTTFYKNYFNKIKLTVEEAAPQEPEVEETLPEPVPEPETTEVVAVETEIVSTETEVVSTATEVVSTETEVIVETVTSVNVESAPVVETKGMSVCLFVCLSEFLVFVVTENSKVFHRCF